MHNICVMRNMLIWFLDSTFLLFFLFCIYILLFMFLNLEVNHHYCIGFIWGGCLLHGIMPVNTEQWHAEIGSFNGCSQHSVVKLRLNLFNLLLLVSFCIIAIIVCYNQIPNLFISNHTISMWFSNFSFNLYFSQQF